MEDMKGREMVHIYCTVYTKGPPHYRGTIDGGTGADKRLESGVGGRE